MVEFGEFAEWPFEESADWSSLAVWGICLMVEFEERNGVDIIKDTMPAFPSNKPKGRFTKEESFGSLEMVRWSSSS